MHIPPTETQGLGVAVPIHGQNHRNFERASGQFPTLIIMSIAIEPLFRLSICMKVL